MTVLAGSTLSGCGLLDGSSRIEEALEYLPADTTRLTFVDRTAIAERTDVADVRTGASEEDLDRWVEASTGEGYGTALEPWTLSMQDAAFSSLDVEWEAIGWTDGPLSRVWKLRDDVDFDAVADDLEDAGYTRGGTDDAPTFTAELADAEDGGMFGGRYPAVLMNVALVPDEHLVLSGAVEQALASAQDDADSLADEGTFEHLLGAAPGTDGVEYAALMVDPLCGSGGNISPEQAARAYAGLEYPARGLAVFAATDEPVAVVRGFDDAETAEADAEALTTHLEETAPRTGLDVTFDVRADGEDVLVEAGWDDRRKVVAAASRGEGPFACPFPS